MLCTLWLGMLLTLQMHYILYVLDLSCAAYCNLIGPYKCLNRDNPTVVHDSPDPLSLPGCIGGTGHETNWKHDGIYSKLNSL